MAELELRNLEKRYPNDTFAVKGVSFAASDGEFVVLVGPSGCGKSTTLRMIAGLEEITGGDLFIGGKRMNDEEPKDRDIAMVFQNYALYPHMSVFDNLAFPLRMRKVSKPEIRRQVEAAAETLSITHLLQRKPKELSGGERQRVAVGRAIVRKPKVFLFDEPLSNLDAALRTQMRAELKRLQRRLGATMIYVTHDQVEAMTMGDRIVVMNKGLVEQVGTPAEIYGRPETVFVARFLGSPPMNMIAGRVAESNGELILTHEADVTVLLPRKANLNGRDVVVAIRPEAVSIVAEGTTGAYSGKLALIEPIGSQTHVYIEFPNAEGGTVTATLSEGNQVSLTQFSLGETIHFVLPTDSMHLFDRASGKRIS